MHSIPLDYTTLRVIWWGLMGTLFIGFAIMDGFTLGTLALLPFAAQTDDERRSIINTVSATWEGNQVWFILGGGAVFAAWPLVYAVSFSGFYLAMFLVLMAFILRPVGFKYRSKRGGTAWRRNWDYALCVSGFLPALIFGVAVGNVLQGAPFSLDGDLRATYHAGTLDGLLGLFTPFTLVCGLMAVAMLALQGATWISLKLEPGSLRDRATGFGLGAGIVAILLFLAGHLFIRFAGLGYHIEAAVPTNGPSNPTLAMVVPRAGGYLQNYIAHPWMWIAPVLGILGPATAIACLRRKSDPWAFIGASLGVFGTIATVGLSMFPIILPSSVDDHSSLLVWTASSSQLTLFIMLGVTALLLPLVLVYTAWVYKVLSGRIAVAGLKTNPDFY